jgi:peptidoglycan hydrolase-like protein with peptidoglycan-binding domain
MKVTRNKRRTSKTVNAKKPVQGKNKKLKPSMVFIYTLALAAIGGSGYLVYGRIRRKKMQELPENNQDRIIINNNLPASYTTVTNSSRTSASSAKDAFPLKRGSRGSRVTMLQQALAKVIGVQSMNANGGIDGQFGPGTANALKMAGYSEVIDEAAFNKLTGSGGSNVTVVFNPGDIAQKLYSAAQAKNLDAVLFQLSQIKSVADYSAVNEYYKKQGFISKTIVTDLLDYAFKANESAKQQLRNEFLRMGLKMDDSGRWSLQGIPVFKDLITLRETFVIDSSSNRIPVKRNTILGDEVKVQNGITWFRSVDNSILKVPTQDVKYA